MIAAAAARSALRRMLANGPVTAVPRPADLELLLALAAARLDRARTYTEPELNDALREWLGSFSSPYGLDHVTFRRALVDGGFVVRDRQGASYRAADVGGRIDAEAARLEPARVLEDVAREREARKRKHAT